MVVVVVGLATARVVAGEGGVMVRINLVSGEALFWGSVLGSNIDDAISLERGDYVGRFLRTGLYDSESG